MLSEKTKMLSGRLYLASDPQLSEERRQARLLLKKLNITAFGDNNKYLEIISKLLPHCPPDICIEPPFYCDYGYNIYTDNNVYFNFDCIIL